MAKKANAHPDEIDLTSYDFVGFSNTSKTAPTCGACHPGGGGMEYDREGNRYDEYLAKNPDFVDSLDGDYYKSNWVQSGIVEADCFICHLEDYNYDERVSQLKKGNYRWAVVAASRIGIVAGDVINGEIPIVKYNKRFFNDDGSITIDMSYPPPDDNCVACHSASDGKKRGFSWNDIHNPDIHNQQGISCAACHPSGLDHNFAKGNAKVSTVADQLDNTMKNCRQCHEEGYLGAPLPVHTKVRPSHLERISCEACHIPELKRAAGMGFDVTTGKLVNITNPSGAGKLGARGSWKPVYFRRDNDVIYPFNNMQAVYWGNLDADGIIYPLFAREHAAGWKNYSDRVEDDNDDGLPEVNTREEIKAGLLALSQTLQGNMRFQKINPVYIKGGHVYGLDDNGEVIYVEREMESAIRFSINHNVAPARMALGNNGCDDCHSEDAHFFKGKIIVDMFAEDGQPVFASIGKSFGCNATIFKINSFHQQILSPIVSIAIILVVFMVTLHYHHYGPKRIPFQYGSGEVKRFSFLERAVHLFRLIAFALLTLTGLIMAFNWNSWQNLIFSSPAQMLTVHIVAGIVFIVTTIMGIGLWFRDAIFASYDKAWVKLFGGYLGYKGDAPAGRFNAGQKMFFWFTAIFGIIMSITGMILVFKYSFALSIICLISTIHNLFAFFMIAGVLAHAYLGTIANPGTWRVLVDGYVTKVWAEHHHPIWYRKIMAKMEEQKAKVKRQEPKSEKPNSNKNNEQT